MEPNDIDNPDVAVVKIRVTPKGLPWQMEK